MKPFLRLLPAIFLVATTIWVGPAAHAAAVSKVLVVGDSITQGSSRDYTWRYRLWKKLQATAPGAVN